MNIIEKLAGRRVVASVSGGKDSAAMSLYLCEQGIDHDRIFLDGGWEADETYRHLDYLETRLGPITRLKGAQMEDLVMKKGMFPSRTRRFCTTEIKVKPAIAHLSALMESGVDVVNAVGIRAGESAARARMPEWEWSDDFDCEIWRPILQWTEADVVDIHTRHGVRPNPLYLKGHNRVGCFPCIFERKEGIRLIAQDHPERIVQIRQLEERVQGERAARSAAKGEPDRNPPTFFQAPVRDENGKRSGIPIDDVVAWSRTVRGGRVEDQQEELFAKADEGCMRWGLCETSSSGPIDR